MRVLRDLLANRRRIRPGWFCMKRPLREQRPWIVLPGDGSRQPRALLSHSLVLYGFQPRGFRLPGLGAIP